MKARFVSHKPWVDETIRLRKALFFTTIFMVLLGLILAILGIVLLAYMEFVVGVISIVFGILIPLGYVGANIALFARRRRAFDKSMIIEYSFDDDGLTITKISDTYKAKNVISYVNLKVDRTFKRSRFIMLKTKSYYTDMIALRKSDIVLNEGESEEEAIVKFNNFVVAKITEAALSDQVTCSNESSDVVEEVVNADEVVEVSDNEVEETTFEDLTESDENVDIEDEAGEGEEVDTTKVKCEVVEESTESESIKESEAVASDAEESQVVESDASNEEQVTSEEEAQEESAAPTDSSLFDYGEVIVDSVPVEKSEEPDNSDLLEYDYDNGDSQK